MYHRNHLEPILNLVVNSAHWSSLKVFYELYSLGMPLLVPEETLLPLFFMRSYGYDGSVQHQRPGAIFGGVKDVSTIVCWKNIYIYSNKSETRIMQFSLKMLRIT